MITHGDMNYELKPKPNHLCFQYKDGTKHLVPKETQQHHNPREKHDNQSKG
jgi:hypothetical protein